ncbi:AAA family ATPase [Nocardia cyriacigeorgica]|uniref:AAA family ATPase n=1 Tax=Nocardia cyriacigeorgica TaxID=135487 RepID=UPI002455FECD|nr:AAA family ATPase [Nocardia cyriacigeorgica]
MSSEHDSTEGDAEEHVYTDPPADTFHGRLVALLSDTDDDEYLDGYLSVNGRDLMRQYYDKRLQDRPSTFFDAPVLRRSWLRGGLLPQDRPTEQEQRDHAEEHGYDHPADLAAQWKRERSARLNRQREEKRVTKAAADALRTASVDPAAEFTPDEIERTGVTWGPIVTQWLVDTNAGRRAVGERPRLTITAAELLRAGATPTEVAALRPAKSAADRAASARWMEAERIAEGEVARTRARRITVEREGGTVEPPELLCLSDLLEEPDEPLVYRVSGLWPLGGRVLLAAQYKSGKSTMVGNAVRSLADGDLFLDRFETEPVGKVVLIDTELDPRTLRRWLREQGIRKTASVSVLPLRGRVSAFDILDRSVRSEWVTRLSGANVVILDCLRPVLDSLGLSEDKDAGKFLVAFDDMLAEAGVGEAMVVTHMGHQNERARGDSRLLDWPDVPWKIVRDENDVRFFSAFGRDVDVPEGALSFDPDSRRLTYEGGSRKDVSGKALMPDLLALLRAQPGLSGRQIETELMNKGAGQRDIRAALKSARTDGVVRVEPGQRNALLHYLKEGDPLDGSAA